MNRFELLRDILDNLDDAIYLMETSEIKPDDNDAIWIAINEAHSLVEDHYINLVTTEDMSKTT